MTTLSIVEAINLALREALETDDRVMLLGQDIGVTGGVFRATDGLFERFGRDRVFDTPLSEAAIVGSSIGLSLAGLVPIAEIQFLGFSYQAFHQIAGQLARYRFRSNGRFSCPVTIRAPFGGGVRTPELHSDSLEALYTHSPGLKVVAPSTAKDAKGLLTASIQDPDPVIFLEPLRGYRTIKDEVPDGEFIVPLGKARLAKQGTDVVVIAWSYMVTVAERAAEALEHEGVSVAVLDLRTLCPLDELAIADVASATGRVVVVQEAPLTGGFASEIAATIQEQVFDKLLAPIQRVTGWDTPYPTALYESYYVPDEDRAGTCHQNDP